MGNTRRRYYRNTSNTRYNTEGVRITAGIHDAFLHEAQLDAQAQPLAEVISEVVGGRMASRLSRNQMAAHAWFVANGDLERSHTCGVYLRRPRVRGADPVLGVYVDTPSRVTDFRANKELYLSRLANVGLAVSDIDFRLTRSAREPKAAPGSPSHARAAARGVSAPLRQLSPGEEERVRDLTAELPEGLRQSAAHAMSAALRREKTDKTQSGT